MKKKILKIESIHQCNCCLGYKTLHPLVSVIDLSKTGLTQQVIRFDFYTVLLLEGECENFLFGRKYYDYSNATIIFLFPGQPIELNTNNLSSPKNRLLAFHPDLLYDTALGKHINDYTFFRYQPDEALHLSLREKNKALDCFNNIEEELCHTIDYHSKTLITRNIELFLDHCTRFYDRQFITRNEENQGILKKIYRLMNEYIRSGQLQNGRLPSADYCGRLLNISPPYFSDLLKFETGKNIYEYFQLKRLETAKQMLLDKNNTVSQVVKQLGYPSNQYFSHLFKKITGIAPADYRFVQN